MNEMSSITKFNISIQTFSKSRFQLAIFLTYLLGASLMFIRIITNKSFSELVPFWYDALVALGGLYGGGLLLVALLKSKINITQPLDRLVFYLIAIHLVAAAFGHVFMIVIWDHQILDFIPLEIVYLLLGAMVALALYSFRIKPFQLFSTSKTKMLD